MPPTGGIGLGTATGTVVINAQVTQAAAQIAAFSQQTEQQFKRVASAATGLAGAFGISFGAQGVAQLAKAAIEADKVATAYNRQMVAAESLAGSQEHLNALLDTYDKATGGILDKSQELAAVTKLMAVGFADSSAELEQFATAIRGISIAMGTSQDTVTQNLILELFSQRGQRLDQLGLQYDKVRAKADELQKADSDLTKEQAYQIAVLDEATKKFGGLVTSSEGAITGIEALGKAWSNLRLELAQELHPGLDEFFKETAAGLDWIRQRRAQIPGEAANLGIQSLPTLTPSAANRSGNRPFTPFAPAGPAANPNQDKIDQAIGDRYSKLLDIERQAGAAILSENASYQNRRLRSEESYQESVVRSAADFAKGRMRAQEDYENSILDIMRAGQQRDARMAEDHARQLERMQSDSASRLADLQEDLDRNNAQKRADSAEKLAEMAADADEAIADKRQDSTDRLLDIEKDYARQQEDAARTHQTNRLEAAARLDARALFFEDRRFNDEQQKAADAQQDKVDDEKDKLQKSLDNINESYNEKLQDEQRALDKSIRQANEAHDRQVKDEQEALQTRIDDANDAYTRQLQDARDADDQRIRDMAAHFDEQKRRENDDQADRMNRMADDHTDEMNQMDTEHGERIKQIGTHATDERKALDDAFQDQVTQLGENNKAWKKAQDDFQKDALSSYQDMLDEQERAQINSQVRQLKNQLISPDLSPDEIQAINNSITTLLTALGNVGAGRSKPGTSPIMVPGGATIMPAMLGVSSAGGVGGGLSVGAINITVNAVATATANSILDVIDERILRTVQMAAARI